jgi:FkbM family methyltransferase
MFVAGIRKAVARSTRRLRADLARPFRRFRPVPDTAQAPSHTEIGPGRTIARLKSGHSLYVDPRDTIVSRRILESGHWEVWTTMAVLSLLRRGDRVVEVGANLGYYTVLMADRVGPGGAILSLEANPRLAAMIEDSVALNGFQDRVSVLNRAALDKPGPISFVTSTSNSGAGHVRILAEAPFADAETITIDAVRLDDVCPDRIDFIRLDAEGCEPQILRGAQDVLARNPDIVVCLEWSVIQILSRTSITDFIDWMSREGFAFWRIDRDARLIPVPGDALVDLPHVDLVAARGDPRRR